MIRKLIVAISALLPALGSGQQPVGDERHLFTPLPSVFAASRFEQPLSDAPSAVSVITAAEIRRHGYRTLADILGGARGFFASNDRNYSYIGMRGFGRSGDFNSRLLLMVDGHRINDNVYGTASVGAEFLVDIDLIERIEIIRGPTSSLYGANAIFGTVNVITRRGRDLDGSVVKLESGSQAARGAAWSTGRRLANGLEYLISASAGRTDGERAIRFPEFDAPATNDGIARNLDAESTRRLFTKLQFDDFGFTAALSERRKSVPTAAFSTVFNDPGYRSEDDQMFLELRHHADLHGGDLRSRVYYDHYFYQGDFPYAAPVWRLNKDSASGRWWGGGLTWSGQPAPAHRVTLGAEYRQNTEIRQRNYDVATNLDDGRRDRTWGVFAQTESRIASRWLASFGLRYDEQSGYGGQFSPRATLNYRPREETAIKLIHGRAFRPPNAYEAFYNDGNVTQKANRALRNESIRTTELAWEEQFSPRWRTSAGIYHYQIDRLITQITDPADGLLVFFNQGAVKARGIELELQGRFANGTELQTSLANQTTQDTAGGPGIANSPKNLFKSRLSVPFANERWNAGVELHYTSARRNQAGVATEPFWLANLTLSGDRVFPGVRLSVSLYNLFDKRYSDPAAPEHIQARIPQPGRTLLGRIEFRF